MLSIWKLRVGMEGFYLDQVTRGLDDYYTGRGEADGIWIGHGADILGLAGRVDADGLRDILLGIGPGTGVTLNGDPFTHPTRRVPGFDLTWSAPKSVSILYALGDRPSKRSSWTPANTPSPNQSAGSVRPNGSRASPW